MRASIKILLYVVIVAFLLLALIFWLQGRAKAAAGGLLFAAVLSPALLEAWWPGRYSLSKPRDGSPDTFANRLRQFRDDHPRWDGRLLVAVVLCMSAVALAQRLIGSLVLR